MKRNSTTAENLIIPICGAANVGHGNLSTGALHFRPVRNQLKRLPGVTVTQPLVPRDLCLLGPLSETYERIADEIDSIIEQHADVPTVIVGHSLGGVFGLKYIASRRAAINLVSLGAPHGGLRPIPALGPVNARVNEINNFVRTIEAVQPLVEGGPHITQIAAARDEIVPVWSALQEIPFATAERHLLLNHFDHTPRDLGSYTVHRTVLPTEHISMLLTSRSVGVTTGAITASLERAELMHDSFSQLASYRPSAAQI